eukprot:CAMPEP_0206601514 /NCGR_PEP_ID=MMETSP0325_2-20121206/46679_1 /ASSEMBLY_ACC=CAM_ASM_000347 /TAXON_ID=2866 /ORGANISM="Crypthecodinium cohnii, Strain Seligo" /LENGTH=44 /DNA_ID= /DNA_START= /DNA_END= /DNA_ORIENTATION=
MQMPDLFSDSGSLWKKTTTAVAVKTRKACFARRPEVEEDGSRGL